MKTKSIFRLLGAFIMLIVLFTACSTKSAEEEKAEEIKEFFEEEGRSSIEYRFRNGIADEYPYVGGEYLLSELLKLKQFEYVEYSDGRRLERYENDRTFYEFLERKYQGKYLGSYDEWRNNYNFLVDGWNDALKEIAILAAMDEDYAVANRCLSEFKPRAEMASRKFVCKDKDGDKLYDFTSKLVVSPTKETTIKKVQSIKMVKDIEREFNAAKFARGSSELSAEAKVVLNKLVSLLKKEEALTVKFIGHTSADGDAAYNQQLSKERARAAANYLESKGVNYLRISHAGKGSDELKNTLDPTSEENCRIEIIIL